MTEDDFKHQRLAILKLDSQGRYEEALAALQVLHQTYPDQAQSLNIDGLQQKAKLQSELTVLQQYNTELQAKFIELELENGDLKKQITQVNRENKALVSEFDQGDTDEMKRLKKHLEDESQKVKHLGDYEVRYYRKSHELSTVTKQFKRFKHTMIWVLVLYTGVLIALLQRTAE